MVHSGLNGQQKKGKHPFCGQDEWNGYMEKSSSGPFFQVHKTDVRNTKLLRIAKQQLVNGHHVEEGCQACRGRVEMLCLHTGTMLYYDSL